MAATVLTVTADTGPMVRKLRAIAKHYAALADELEAIDAEGVDTGGGTPMSEEQRAAVRDRERYGRRSD